ncbi:peptidylprolyl isomerase [Rhodoblastus sphagnicola]|nr:peptidylprolyl isomerase [Rhodoblastus sphagnicola]MBB4198986.1 peptidylprolyl isomerase [Rhodoblastus sphagnicola]
MTKAGVIGSAALAVVIGMTGVTNAQSAPQQNGASTATKPKPVSSPATQPVATGRPVAATEKSSSGDDVVARVGNANISAEEIRAYVATLRPADQEALKQNPAILSQAVRMLLANRLVLEELRSRKWDQQASVTTQLERMREGALVELYLQMVSTPPASYPGEDELQKVYDANREAFLTPRQFEVAQIFVAAAKDGDKTTEDAARKRLEDVQRKLKAPGADFAAIATESGAANGGALGLLVESQFRPEIRPHLAGLAKGAISEPVRLDDGWHILKLIDTKAAYTRTLPEVREALVQQMRAERARALRQAYLAEVLKQNPPVLNELAIANLVAQPPAGAK